MGGREDGRMRIWEGHEFFLPSFVFHGPSLRGSCGEDDARSLPAPCPSLSSRSLPLTQRTNARTPDAARPFRGTIIWGSICGGIRILWGGFECVVECAWYPAIPPRGGIRPYSSAQWYPTPLTHPHPPRPRRLGSARRRRRTPSQKKRHTPPHLFSVSILGPQAALSSSLSLFSLSTTRIRLRLGYACGYGWTSDILHVISYHIIFFISSLSRFFSLFYLNSPCLRLFLFFRYRHAPMTPSLPHAPPPCRLYLYLYTHRIPTLPHTTSAHYLSTLLHTTPRIHSVSVSVSVSRTYRIGYRVPKG
ncbi:hypothetical protein B0H13DRAFT_894672 [Mycena leptocephala]|nr:hypothetical protein B0H13DRAFT_894672 [Mycena leptocephala]